MCVLLLVFSILLSYMVFLRLLRGAWQKKFEDRCLIVYGSLKLKLKTQFILFSLIFINNVHRKCLYMYMKALFSQQLAKREICTVYNMSHVLRISTVVSLFLTSVLGNPLVTQHSQLNIYNI